MGRRSHDRRKVDDFLPLKPATFHVLLALCERELHGYGIMKAVEDETAGQLRMNPSPLYRQLKRMLEQGIVQEVEPEPGSEPDDERRRYYGLTSLGRRVLAEEAVRVVALSRNHRVRALAAKVE